MSNMSISKETNIQKEKSSFDCLYSEHVSLLAYIKCRQCGTIILYKQDEDYEPNLACPVCTNYKTRLNYWTKEIIDNDEDLQKFFTFIEEIGNKQREQELVKTAKVKNHSRL